MARPEYKLGDEEFLTLSSPLIAPTEELELLVRKGVPGVGLWKTNVRGRPFEAESQVDTISLPAARTKYAEDYRPLVGADPLTLVWADIDLETTEDLLFAVLSVEVVEMRRMLTAVGGINPPSEGLLICRWSLIAVPK